MTTTAPAVHPADRIIGEAHGVHYNRRLANTVHHEMATFIAQAVAKGDKPDAWQVEHFTALDEMIAADIARLNAKSYARLASRRRD